MSSEEATLPAVDDAPSPASGRRAAFAFVLVTVMLDVLAMAIILPVLPRLILQFRGGDTADAAALTGLFGAVWWLMQLLWSQFIGVLSDRFGRRPVILLSNLGLGLDYVMMALAPGVALLFVGRVISGITAATFSTAGAYIADAVEPKRRAGAFGMMSAAFGIGFIAGPALGGVLGDISPRLPFWCAACLSLANACYGFFVLPESLAPERRDRFRWSRANPLGALALLRAHRSLYGLVSVNFLVMLAQCSLPAVFVLYGGYRYGWDAKSVGLALAASGATSIVVGGFLVRPVVARFGERPSLVMGLLFGMVGFWLFGTAQTGLALLVAIPVLGLWGFAGPAAQALMTRHISPSEQGQLQGANSTLQAVAGLIGQWLFAMVFAFAVRHDQVWHLAGAPFFLAALLTGAAAGLAWLVTRKEVAVNG
jgi:DHA1 family tetracycline resistance protein-like MFS transporter